MTLSALSPEALQALPLFTYTGPTYIVTELKVLRPVVETLSKEPYLGFDTESRPSFRADQQYSPALVQLASREGVYLFPLLSPAHWNHLKPLLEAAVPKVGLAVADDVKRLQRLGPFEPQGFTDVTTLSKPLGYKPTGLRGLAALCLGVRISKRAQLSNWARFPLTEAQVRYAATDAWVSLRLYEYCLQRSSGNATPNVPVC